MLTVRRYLHDDLDNNNLIASSDAGIFKTHLQRHLWNLQQHEDIGKAFRRVIDQDTSVRLTQPQSFKLNSIGLVTLDRDCVQISRDLYRDYFRQH